MTDLVIHDEDIALRLREIARRENRSIEDVLASLLETYANFESEVDKSEPKPGTFAALAASARRANIRSDKPVDTAARSRQILRDEFPDYIRRPVDDQQSDTD